MREKMSAIPQRFVDIWALADDSCKKNTSFQTLVVCSRGVWNKLASASKIPAERARKAADDGHCNVQVFDEHFADDPSSVLVFRIIKSWEEIMTIIAIERT